MSSLACPLPSARRSVMDKLNAEWHKPALLLYGAIVLLHWGEHLLQAFQVYVLGWPLKEARGLLGMPFPWLVKSEALHYGYAIVMLVAFWVLRKGFVGRSYVWWMIAFWIQFWHHIEHGLLQYQVISGANFFGAPAPISVIQMLGFLEGDPAKGFGGLMTGPPAHEASGLMLFVRRLEVHLFYNTIVFIPMAVAMFQHMFPRPGEEAHMNCNCVLFKKPKTQPVSTVPAGGA
jgi:hypothetical protein